MALTSAEPVSPSAAVQAIEHFARMVRLSAFRLLVFTDICPRADVSWTSRRWTRLLPYQWGSKGTRNVPYRQTIQNANLSHHPLVHAADVLRRDRLMILPPPYCTEFKYAIKSATSCAFPNRGHTIPACFIRFSICGPCRHSAEIIVTSEYFRACPGNCGAPCVPPAWQLAQRRSVKTCLPRATLPPGYTNCRIHR